MNIDKWLEDHPEWKEHTDLVVVPPTAEHILEECPDASGDILKQGDEWTSFSVTRGALYMMLRRKGQTHRFAEVISFQQPPGCGITDDVFFQGVPRLAEQMGPQLGDLIASARRHGFEPPADSFYQSGLARFRGDPEAFVTRAMGRSYIKKLCEKRGWACEGAVETEHRQPEHDPYEQSVPLADDIVRDNAARMVKKNPDLQKLSRKELRQKVLEKHGPTK